MNLIDENVEQSHLNNIYNQKCNEIYEFITNIDDSSDPEIIKAYLIEAFNIKGSSISNHPLLAHFIIHPKYRSIHEKFYGVLDQLIENGLSDEDANFLSIKKCCILLYRINDCLMPTNTTDSIMQIISDLNNENDLLFNCHKNPDIQSVMSSFCIYYENLMIAIVQDSTTEDQIFKEFFGNHQLQYYNQLRSTFDLGLYAGAVLETLKSYPLLNKVMWVTMQYYMGQGMIMSRDISSVSLPPESLFVTKIDNDTYRIFEVPNEFPQKTEITNSILSFAKENFALIHQFLETSKRTCKFSKQELDKISNIYHELVKMEFSQLSISSPSDQHESSTQREITYKIDEDIYQSLCKESQEIISISKKTAIKNLDAPTVANQILEVIAYSTFANNELQLDKVNPVFHKLVSSYFKLLNKTMLQIAPSQVNTSGPVESSTFMSTLRDEQKNSIIPEERSVDKLESSIDISGKSVHSDREVEYNNYIQHAFRLYKSILNSLSGEQIRLASKKQEILDQIEVSINTLDSSDFDKIENQFIGITTNLVTFLIQYTNEKILNKDRQEHSVTYTAFLDKMLKIADLIEYTLNIPRQQSDYSEIHQIIREFKLLTEKSKLLLEKENLVKNKIEKNQQSEGKYLNNEANQGKNRVHSRRKKSQQRNRITSKLSDEESLKSANVTDGAVQPSKTDAVRSTKNNGSIARKSKKKKKKLKDVTTFNLKKASVNIIKKAPDSSRVVDTIAITTSEAMNKTEIPGNEIFVPNDNSNQEYNSEFNKQAAILHAEESTEKKDNVTACSAAFFIAPRTRKQKITKVTLSELKKIQESALPHLKNVVLNSDPDIARKEIEFLNIYQKAFENGNDLLCAEALLYLIDIKLGLYEKLVAYYHKLNPGEKESSGFYLEDESIAATASSHRDFKLSQFLLDDDNNPIINQALEYRNLYRIILHRHQERTLAYICNEKAASFTL